MARLLQDNGLKIGAEQGNEQDRGIDADGDKEAREGKAFYCHHLGDIADEKGRNHVVCY